MYWPIVAWYGLLVLAVAIAMCLRLNQSRAQTREDEPLLP